MADKPALTPSTINIVKQYLDQVSQAGIVIDEALVFGSQAKGTATNESDIDLCVVSPQFGHNRYEERLKLLKLTNQTTIDVEPHPYSAEDLAFTLDPLAAEIRRFGIPIKL